MLIYGIILVLGMTVMPEGLIGWLRRGEAR
jgi:ABC-type branched-subunit amino acid transport system permease subunit